MQKNHGFFPVFFNDITLIFCEKYEKNDLYIMKKKGARAREPARAFPNDLFLWRRYM